MSEAISPLGYTLEEGEHQGPGSGQCVVFVHGFPDGPSVWDMSAEHLIKQGYRVVRVTLPGFDNEDIDPSPIHFGLLVERLYQTLDESDALGATLIGHDWGAIFLYQLLRRYPHAAGRLITLEIGAGPRTPWLALFVFLYHALLILIYQLGPKWGDKLMERLCASLPRPAYANPPRPKAKHGWLYRQAWREGSEEGPWPFYYRNLIAKWRPSPEVPVLFLYGEESPRLFRFHSKAWRDALCETSPKHQAQALPGKHWFFLEHVDAFHAALDLFLSQDPDK